MTTDVRSLAFGDIHEGLSAGFEHTLTAAEIDAFASLSGDVSPLHVSDEFARQRGFPGRVVHGALLTALVSRLFGVHLPGANCLLQSLAMKYLRPAHGGDALRVEATVTQTAEAVRAFTAAVTITRAGEVVATGKAQVGFTGP
jgi:3-hydroxybutyryl-CoA dehydratase